MHETDDGTLLSTYKVIVKIVWVLYSLFGHSVHYVAIRNPPDADKSAQPV